MKNSFCGLSAPHQPKEKLTNILERMGQNSSSDETSQLLIESTGSSGIAVSGQDKTRCLIAQGGLVGAIAGSPYWSSDDLENIHRQSGFAESITTAYLRHGMDLLKFLRGAFSLALTDTANNETLLAIDRMGICQLYYSYNPNEGIVFGTEARSLHAHGEFPPLINDQAIFDYLYFHMVPSPGSVFQDQYKLKPGECLNYSFGKLTNRQYWAADFDETGRSGRRQLEDELIELLRQSVRRSSPDDRTGCFLSGGIDSSTIAGILAELQKHAKSFTIGFQEKGYDETDFARVTAGHFNTEQTEYFVSPSDVVDILPRIAESYDEPFGNSSVVPTYYCARLAKENGIDSLLAGDGGDELFGGNVRYVTQQVFGIYEHVPQWLRSALIEPISFKMPGADKFLPTRKLQSYIRQAKVPMPDRFETYNHLNRGPIDGILHPEFLASLHTNAPIELFRNTYNSSNATSMLNKMLELDWKFTLADNDLRKVNRMCELANIEVRYPFLDDDIVEFSARVPPSMKISLFRLRHFFKRAMRDFLPQQVLRKSKHGFGLPFGVWMKSYKPLQDLAYDSLSDIGKRNIVQPAYLDQLIQAHRSAHAHYYGEFIWVLLMLELWLKTHSDQTTSGTRA